MKTTKFLAAGLIAAMMVPAAVQAQTREIREDRRDVREERREYKDALRHGDRRDIREERREYNDARRDLRESKADWRRDRRYQSYHAPFRYQQFRAGAKLRPGYYAPAYRLSYDPRWGLPRANPNLAYVRHYNDLLLVNLRSGKVMRVYQNHFRWR